MRHIGLALMAYVALVLDVGARSELSLYGVPPEFLLLTLSAAVVRLRDNSAVVWAAAIGLLTDCISSGPLGVSMFCSIIAVVAIRKMLPRRKAYVPPAAVGICAALTFAVLVSSSTARSLILGKAVDWSGMLAVTAGGAVYTAVWFAGLRIASAGLTHVLLRFVGADMLPRGALPRR